MKELKKSQFLSSLIDKYSYEALAEYLSISNTIEFLQNVLSSKYSELEYDLLTGIKEFDSNGK